MRKLPAAVGGLIVVAALAHSVAFASSPLSGRFESQIGLDIPAGGFTLQTASNVTFAEFELTYDLGDVTLFSFTSYDATGMALFEVGGWGIVGSLDFDSRLTFSPVLGGVGSTLDLSQSWINPSHLYDFGRIYFVDQVEVTSLTLEDNVNTRWRVRVSKDASSGSWMWISDETTGNGSVPVAFPVGKYNRYVEIVGISGYVSDSAISTRVSSEAFVTRVEMETFGISLEAEFAYATGGSQLEFSLGSVDRDSFFDEATLRIGLDPVTCLFCFETVDIELRPSFACLEESSLDIAFDFDDGFSEFAFDSGGIPTGLSWLSIDLSIDFSLTAKDVHISPSLELEDYACVTPYVSIDFGTETWQLDGLTLYGLRFRGELNGVTVEDLTYLDDIHHTKEDYWEMIRISVDGDACCGGGFDFETTTHFRKNHTTLFDWAETSLEVEYDLGSNVTVGGYVEIVSTGLSDLIASLEVVW